VREDELGFTNYSDKNILRKIPKGSFLDMGLFPNELHYFQYHMDDFRCQFYQHFTHKFFVQRLFRQLFSSYMYVEKAAEMTFVQKICTQNVVEIDFRKTFRLKDAFVIEAQTRSEICLNLKKWVIDK
jgi:hypothetical protein